jgi:hypothetical protein
VDGYVASATDGEGRSRPGAEPPVLKTGNQAPPDQLQCRIGSSRCRRFATVLHASGRVSRSAGPSEWNA